MHVPSKFVIDQPNTMHKNFIWNNKRPKIKHSALIVDYCKGAYKDVDIENKIAGLEIKWVTKLLDSNFYPWKIRRKRRITSDKEKLSFHYRKWKKLLPFL